MERLLLILMRRYNKCKFMKRKNVIRIKSKMKEFDILVQTNMDKTEVELAIHKVLLRSCDRGKIGTTSFVEDSRYFMHQVLLYTNGRMLYKDNTYKPTSTLDVDLIYFKFIMSEIY